MTGARIHIDATGIDEAQAALREAMQRAADPRPMFDTIGASLVTSTVRRFETGTAPDSSVWPPSIRALAEGGKTLVDSARLMRSITFVASSRGVEVGTNVVYAAIHQFGGVIRQAARSAVLHFRRMRSGATRFSKPGKASFAQKRTIGARTITMPARPFLGLDDADRLAIEGIAGNWLKPAGSEARP